MLKSREVISQMKKMSSSKFMIYLNCIIIHNNCIILRRSNSTYLSKKVVNSSQFIIIISIYFLTSSQTAVTSPIFNDSKNTAAIENLK